MSEGVEPGRWYWRWSLSLVAPDPHIGRRVWRLFAIPDLVANTSITILESALCNITAVYYRHRIPGRLEHA